MNRDTVYDFATGVVFVMGCLTVASALVGITVGIWHFVLGGACGV